MYGKKALPMAFLGTEPCGLLYGVAAGNPVGWMYPSFQATRMQTKSSMEKPTRQASACAMRAFLVWSLRSLRTMKNSATPKLANIATKASSTNIFMALIIP